MVFFARYVLTAGAATCVDVALVQTLLGFSPLQHNYLLALAMVLGAVAGTGVNFALSRRYVFAPDQRPARIQLFSFAMVSLTTLGLRLLVAYALMAFLALPLMTWIGVLPIAAPDERLAHLGAVGLVTIYSFLAHKHISFGGGLLNRPASRKTVVS